MKSVSHLPDTDNSVGDEDKKNDDRLNKGRGCLLSFLKQSQHLDDHKGHIKTFYTATLDRGAADQVQLCLAVVPNSVCLMYPHSSLT